MNEFSKQFFLLEPLNYLCSHFPSCSASVAGDATNIILDPIFIFVFRLGVSGAAIAHVISQ